MTNLMEVRSYGNTMQTNFQETIIISEQEKLKKDILVPYLYWFCIIVKN